MFTTLNVQLSPASLLRLVEWQRREGGTHDLSETLNAALDFWLDAKTALPPGAEFARHFARTARNAWFDLSVRRPGDKRFTMADVLRREQAKQERTKASTPNPAMPAIAPAAPLAAAPAVEATPPPARGCKTDFEPGWNLPERRKFRYRLEDVAY